MTVREDLARNPTAPIAAAVVVVAAGAAALVLHGAGALRPRRERMPGTNGTERPPSPPAPGDAPPPISDVAPPPTPPPTRGGPWASNVFTGKTVPLALARVTPGGLIDPIASPDARRRAQDYMLQHPDWQALIMEGDASAPPGAYPVWGSMVPMLVSEPTPPPDTAPTPTTTSDPAAPGGEGPIDKALDFVKDTALRFIPGTRIPVPTTLEGGALLGDLGVRAAESVLKGLAGLGVGIGAGLLGKPRDVVLREAKHDASQFPNPREVAQIARDVRIVRRGFPGFFL